VEPPLPLNGILTRASDALLVRASVALYVPLPGGVNWTLNVVLCPAAMVTGRLDINVKALVEMLAAETVTDAVPELVALMVRVLLLPLVIVPKPSDDAPMESRPDAGGVPVPVTPAQPVHIMTEKSRATTANVSNGRDEIRLGAEDDIDSWEANHVSSPSHIQLIARPGMTHGSMSLGSMAILTTGPLVLLSFTAKGQGRIDNRGTPLGMSEGQSGRKPVRLAQTKVKFGVGLYYRRVGR